ncbi:MAG: hypothetical protein ABI187_07890 [Ornithinibacter sp.]
MSEKQPTEEHLDKARAEHEAAAQEKDAKTRQDWSEQASEIAAGMAARQRQAEAMGDYVEPIVRTPKPDINDPRNIAR